MGYPGQGKDSIDGSFSKGGDNDMASVERHRKRDPEAKRTLILAAAESLFVERGFAATSLSDIAKRAGVTKSLIHHHFRTKEGLWDEVKRERLSHYAELQTQLVVAGVGDESVLEESIRAYFRYVQENPQWVRLNAWMTLEDPRLSEVVDPDLVRLGIERLKTEQEQGRVRRDLDPRNIVAAFVSLCMYWFMARESYRLADLADLDADSADKSYLEDMLKIFLEGVIPR